MTLGEIIKKYRDDTGLSMDGFAQISGLSKSYISVLERNRTPHGNEPSPGIDSYRAVAKALGIDVNDLIRAVDDDIELPRALPDNVIPYIPAGRVPLVGDIACGEPILAEQNIVDYVDVPGHIKADYALTCHGESMINLGIREGDIVYIRQQEIVNNGQIAAVIIDDEEATLKKFHYDGDTLVLIPANDDLDPRVFVGEAMNRVRVLGLAVGFTHVFKHE